MGRVNWMSFLAVGLAITALVLTMLDHQEDAVVWAYCSLSAAVLAHLK